MVPTASHRPPLVRTLVLVLLAISVGFVPAAMAHGDEGHGGDGDGDASSTGPDVPEVEAYSEVPGLGTFWGSAQLLPTANHTPRNPAASGPWVVWEAHGDGDVDIMAYNRVTGDRQTLASALHREWSPDVHGDTVVWLEESREGWSVHVMDLRTGQTHTVATSPTRVRGAVAGDGYVAWEEDRGSWDVMAHDIGTNRTVEVASSGFREGNAVFAGSFLAWRVREYQQWDVKVRNLATGDTRYVTRDIARETYLHADGDRLVFLRPNNGPRSDVVVHDPARDRTETVAHIRDFGAPVVLRDEVLFTFSVYVRNSTLVHENLELGRRFSMHSPRLPFQGPLVETDGVVYTTVELNGSLRLLEYAYPDQVRDPWPTVVVDEPTADQFVAEEFTVRGHITDVEGWGPPQLVLVSVDGGRTWHEANGTDRWSIGFDATDLTAGSHAVEATAYFDEGPPQTGRSTIVVVRDLGLTRDLSTYGDEAPLPLWMAIVSNAWLLTLLILLLVAIVLAALRAYLQWSRKRPRGVEYVGPDDPEDRIRVAGRLPQRRLARDDRT